MKGIKFSAGDRIAAASDGRYKLIEPLGKGGSSRVFKAVNTRSGINVAIKILKTGFGDSTGAALRFRRELEICNSFDHPNIVKIFECVCEEDLSFLVMEYMDGGTLEDVVKRRTPSVAESLLWIEQILKGLSVAHERGIVHRDIKMSNILVDRDGRVVISDFGSSLDEERFTRISRTGSIIGTPEYIAPELWKGGNSSKASDIYSLGIVMFELLNGHMPFEADSDYGYLTHHLRTIPRFREKFVSNVPLHLKKITLKCLSKKPDKRYRDANEVTGAINEKGVFSSIRNFFWNIRGSFVIRMSLLVAVIMIVLSFLLADNYRKGYVAVEVDELRLVLDGVDVGPELKKVAGKDMKELHVRILPSGKVVRVTDKDEIKREEGGPYTSMKELMNRKPFNGLKVSGTVERNGNGSLKSVLILQKSRDASKKNSNVVKKIIKIIDGFVSGVIGGVLNR